MAQDNSTFQNLVTGISSDERERMLNRMKQGGGAVENGSGAGRERRPDALGGENDLDFKLKQVPLLKRVWYWLLAAFTNASVEDVFNRALVNGIARDLDREAPGLIDFRRKSLISAFYEKFADLKAVAEFFAPFIERYEANPGAFYALLGHLVIPDVDENIKRSADPFQYPFDKNITKEMKASLLRKMDSVLEDISSQKRADMYASVRSVEWLRQFVRLPYAKVLAKFVASETGARECPFTQLKPEFSELARIFCNYVPLTNEAMQALFLFYDRAADIVDFTTLDASTENCAEFLSAADSQAGIIRMFAQDVPMYALAKVVYDNAVYQPEAYGGGEDWLVKFKAQWKVVFDYRWELWNHDYKKEKLKGKLLSYFHLSDFPLFPFRPWEKVWGGVPFHYELTLGFINSFVKNEVASYMPALRAVGVEGIFALKDNQVEFTDTMNLFAKVNDDLDVLANQLSAGGEYGLELGKYEGRKQRTDEDAEIVASMMDDIEQDVNGIINSFGKACRSMKNLMGGMLGQKVTAYYGTLTNLSKLHGRGNKKFREQLVRASLGVEHAYELVQDIEPLDIHAVGK